MSDKDYVEAIRGDGAIDIDSLKELSREDYEDENEGVVASQEDDDDEAAILEPEKEVEGEKKDSDEEADESSEKEEDSKDDEDEDKESEEKSDSESDDDDSLVVAKGPDGAELKIPKEATFEVVVNGRKVEMTLAEIQSRASGDVHIQQESSRLGRERAELEKQRTEWQKQVEAAEENLEIIANSTPEEFFHHYAMMVNRSPAEVYKEFVEKTLKYAADFENMTPEQRRLVDESAKLRLEQRRFEKEKRTIEAQREQQRQIEEVEQLLSESGVSWDEFSEATQFLAERVSPDAPIGPETVVQQVFILRHYNKVVSAIGAVNQSVLKDAEKVQQLYDGIARVEALTRKQMTQAEAQRYVEEALGVQKRPSLSESLSTKVDRVQKTGKTTSKNANSQKRREEEKYHDTLTLAEHRERMSQLE